MKTLGGFLVTFHLKIIALMNLSYKSMSPLCKANQKPHFNIKQPEEAMLTNKKFPCLIGSNGGVVYS